MCIAVSRAFPPSSYESLTRFFQSSCLFLLFVLPNREQLDPPPSPFLPPASPFSTAKKRSSCFSRSLTSQPSSTNDVSPPPAFLLSRALDESSASSLQGDGPGAGGGGRRHYQNPRRSSFSASCSSEVLRGKGELSRFFLGLLSSEFSPCLRQAFGFYSRAIQLFPHDGLVFNQMAMLCTKLHQHSQKSLQHFLLRPRLQRTQAREGGDDRDRRHPQEAGETASERKEDEKLVKWVEYRKFQAPSHAVGALYWCLRAHIW